MYGNDSGYNLGVPTSERWNSQGLRISYPGVVCEFFPKSVSSRILFGRKNP